MRMSNKVKVIFGIGVLLFLLSGWQYGSYWLKHGYSNGSRTGIIRKVSIKGPPYCKYLSGELAMQGPFGQAAEIFEFSVDDYHDSNPVVRELHEAERTGQRITLDYRQDLSIWWRCNPSSYFIVRTEK
jgi:hypothetical protein